MKTFSVICVRILIVIALFASPAASAERFSENTYLHTTPSLASRGIFFTFFSPDDPWEESDADVLRRAVEDFYPVIESVYGPPAFAITVNVRKDPSIGLSGEYSPRTKEILLRDATQLDVLCHEMIHAFRDEYMLSISSFEEGMARAVEVEVFNRLPDYTFWNENHRYLYDVYYEGLNKQMMGSQTGNFDYASPFLLLRYDLTGYAWAKVFLENPGFFIEFNRMLFEEAARNPSILSDLSALKELASSAQPIVEGKPFAAWYEQQGIFDPHPGEGHFLYTNISTLTIYYFSRDLAGSERMIAGAPIEWEVYDYEDTLIAKGDDVTSPLGWVSIFPSFPEGYSGRIKVVASALTPSSDAISNTALSCVGENKGVFGIVDASDGGTIVVIPLDSDSHATVATVTRGTFSLAPLEKERGRFVALFADGGGRLFSKRFNKDASLYFLSMAQSDGEADLVLAQSAESSYGTIGNDLVYTLTVTNAGPGMATDVFLADALPPSVIYVSAVPSQGRCRTQDSMILCALDTIEPGAQASVEITVIPTQAGAIENTAFAATNAIDRNIENNRIVSNMMISETNPAIQAIRDLIGKIEMLVHEQALSPGHGRALRSLLEGAEKNVRQNNPLPAVKKTRALINHVNALVRAGVIPDTAGAALEESARIIIRLLTPQHRAPSP